MVSQASSAPHAPSVWPVWPFSELTGDARAEHAVRGLALGDVAQLGRGGVRVHVADVGRGEARVGEASRITASMPSTSGAVMWPPSQLVP